MLKEKQLLNYWALMPTQCVTSSHSSYILVALFHAFPSSDPYSQVLSLQNTAFYFDVCGQEVCKTVEGFLFLLSLSAGKT